MARSRGDMSIPFGLFHLPGLAIGIGALKMVATSAAFSFVFAFSLVVFRSLWAATTVHVVSNLFLHAITGLDGGNRALLTPVFDENWPTGYDPGFIVMIVTSIVIAGTLYFGITRKEQ